MTVAVVSTSYREADVLDLWIRHLLAEEVDIILIADKLSDDSTRDILGDWHQRDERVEWIDDTEDSHRQAWWTDRLACMAHDRGADWILPTDIDEFPYAPSGATIAATLKDCPHDKLFMRVWQHLDWSTRFADAHRLPKCAYRWSPDAHVRMGSHNVNIAGGVWDILEMRELKYRGFNHFCQKVADRNATLEPAARCRGDGAHHLWLEHADQAKMEAAWEKMTSVPIVQDEIPSHYRPGSVQHSQDQ